MAEPVDSAVSSPGAYLALGLLYTVAALPAIVAPQAVCASELITNSYKHRGPLLLTLR